MKKSIYTVILIILLFVMVFSGAKIVGYYGEAYTQKKMYDEVAKMVEWNNKGNTGALERETASMLSAYVELFNRNSDVVGWIKIEDTPIDYPVMQSPDEPDFYLNHGFDREYTVYGCPYASESCDVLKPSDNIIIYGHHMKNGSMFAGLDKFMDKEFWEKHGTFRFDTLYEKQSYEIVAVFKTAVDTGEEDEFEYYRFVDAGDEEEFDDYIRRAKELALYDTGISAVYGDKLVTLSTCEYSEKNGRLVVVAKKI